MTTEINQTIPVANSWKDKIWQVSKETAVASLPFLALYKPLSFPIALGAGALRVGVHSITLVDALVKGDYKQIFSELTGTTVAVISLAATFFAHPLGILISTGYDLILELRTLIQHVQKGDIEAALKSSLKIAGHALYFTVFLYGGLEMTLAFLAVQVITGCWEARHEFKEGHYISAMGHVLMAMLKGGQLTGQVQMLQVKREFNAIAKHLASMNPSDPDFEYYVGKLAEKWQFPSDHLPVGATVGNTHVISWNVLNDHFMEWVTDMDSQGLQGSLISKLDAIKSSRFPGLTLRDELVATLLLKMMNDPAHKDHLILALQECSPEFIHALEQMLPSHMGMITDESPLKAIDHNIVLYNKETFTYLPDESHIVKAFTESDRRRPLMDLSFIEKATGEKLQVINAHIPGDPLKPGRNEFARYVLTHQKEGYSTIALGDMNFTKKEMRIAFEEEAAKLGIELPFKNWASYNTNISPFVFTTKSIDHIWVKSDLPCRSMEPDEVLAGLQETADLINPKLEEQKKEELRQWELAEQLKYLKERQKAHAV